MNGPEQAPHLGQRAGHWLGLGATVVAGGAWGALLSRVVVRCWPLALFPAGKAGLWLGLPWLALPVSFCAAALTLFSFVTLARIRAGQAIFARAWPLSLAGICLLYANLDPAWSVGALVAGLGGTVWLCHRKGLDAFLRAEWLWDVLAFLVPLALYWSTLAPSVLPGDSGEFQLAAAVLGIPHPTGYPLYLLLGKLFSWLPLGSIAYRLNLLSAVAAAGAVWAVYRAGRALGLRRAASLLGAALLMVSETLWSQATIAEKYTLHALAVACTLWLILQWRRERQSGRSGRGWLVAWALCCGLALTHHRTIVMLMPAFLWILYTTDRSVLHWSSMLRLAGLALPMLSLYLLLPLFSSLHPPYAYTRVDSLASFLDLILAQSYQGSLFRGGWSALPGRLAEFGPLLARQFGPWGLGLSVIGWGVLLRRDQHAAWMLLAGMLAGVVFALNYYVPNTFVYYLPVYVWLAVCAGVVLDEVLERAGHLSSEQMEWRERSVLGRLGGNAGAYLTLAVVLVVGTLPIHLFTVRWKGMDQGRAYSQLPFDHAYGQLAMRSVEPNALIISDWMPATVLWYTQFVEGVAPTAQVAVTDPLEMGWADLARGALAAGRPVYLARPLMAAGDHYALTSAGPLVQVLARPRVQAPPMSHLAGRDLEGGMRLVGVDLQVAPPGYEGARHLSSGGHLQSGGTLYTTLYWQATAIPAGDYAVTVYLVDAQGHRWLERQNRHPVGGTYPTSRWQIGEVVGDYYELALPPSLPSGEYRLEVTIGAPFAGRGLVDDTGSDVLPVAVVRVDKPLRWPHAAPGRPVRQAFGGGLLLTGYDAPDQVHPGETASIDVQWLVCTPGKTTSRPALVGVDRKGERHPLEPLPSAAEDWQAGALVVEHYSFAVPDDLARIEVVGEHPWLSLPLRHRLPVQVSRASPPVARFGDEIHLLSYAYSSDSFRPGETVRLTLDWKAVRQVTEPYKVFVHILGPQGLPIAQQDNEPVNGTYPTTRWQSGERISDPYAIALPASLAPGEYRVEVGLYRISDLGRLFVVDEEGAVVDDKVFLQSLVVR